MNGPNLHFQRQNGVCTPSIAGAFASKTYDAPTKPFTAVLSFSINSDNGTTATFAQVLADDTVVLWVKVEDQKIFLCNSSGCLQLGRTMPQKLDTDFDLQIVHDDNGWTGALSVGTNLCPGETAKTVPSASKFEEIEARVGCLADGEAKCKFSIDNLRLRVTEN